MYKVEKNIPYPRRDDAKYPFPGMKVGDSFLVPPHERHAVRSAAISFSATEKRRGFDESEIKWSVRKFGDEYRIWRIA